MTAQAQSSIHPSFPPNPGRSTSEASSPHLHAQSGRRRLHAGHAPGPRSIAPMHACMHTLPPGPGPNPFPRQKPPHRLGRRLLLVHRQSPRVGGHGAGSPAARRRAIAGSRGWWRRASLPPRRGWSHLLPRGGPEAARRDDVRGRARQTPRSGSPSPPHWAVCQFPCGLDSASPIPA